MARSELRPDDYANIGRLLADAGLAEWMWREWFRRCDSAAQGMRVDEMTWAKRSRKQMSLELKRWTEDRQDSPEAQEAFACERDLLRLLANYRDPLAHCAAVPVLGAVGTLANALFHLGKRTEIDFLDTLPKIDQDFVALATRCYRLTVLSWLAR